MSETRPQLEQPIVRGIAQFTEPRMAPIPEGWFMMGCDSGRDDERPEHRVWIDGFSLGVYQVTRAEYACFLADTRATPPPFWDAPIFRYSRQPVAGPSWFEAAAF